ncbi:MAG: polysaccharide deacetylase family protein [Sedimentisphaerales bacterium]|nr:polysaccharide deacetylase family protein [Sedimentisphaerales bacterium]
MMLNALSFNVESYGDALAAAPHSPNAVCPSDDRIEYGLSIVRELLERYNTQATFFFSGEIARRHPEWVRRLSKEGHEIAAQLMTFRRLVDIPPEHFRGELQQCKTLLEDLIDRPVRGFRAPYFSMIRQTFWTLDEIVHLGFNYDASIIPVRHGDFGIPEVLPNIHKLTTLEHQHITEVPPLTIGWTGHRFPLGTTPYLRLIPSGWTWLFIRRRNRAGFPTLINFNTWEFDPAQPRLTLPWLKRAFHYYNLSGTIRKLKYLCRHVHFAPIAQFVFPGDSLLSPAG